MTPPQMPLFGPLYFAASFVLFFVLGGAHYFAFKSPGQTAALLCGASLASVPLAYLARALGLPALTFSFVVVAVCAFPVGSIFFVEWVHVLSGKT